MTQKRQSPPLLQVDDLKVHFRGPRRKGNHSVIRAVDGVSLEVRAGETLGVVGESGCGKSTTGRALLRLIEPTGGTIRFDGADMGIMSRPELMQIRRRTAMIFQDPMGSFNPTRTVGASVAEPLAVHGLYRDGAERRQRVVELLELVGLKASDVDKYPTQFSGGQRQRLGIARALSTDPELLVCDEPIAALDASVQAEVLNLLRRLQSELGLAYIFIAHDVAAVRYVSDRIAVMYLGRVVEEGPAEDVCSHPFHPYTRSLIDAVPEPVVGSAAPLPDSLKRDLPSPANPPSGCNFRTRCPRVFDACHDIDPALIPVRRRHTAACLLHTEQHHYAETSTTELTAKSGKE